MRNVPRTLSLLLAVLGLVVGASVPALAEGRADKVQPLAQAHAHNDYEHERPLLDALDHGFTSVESDIYLEDDQLLVGHDPEDLAPERNLRALYLEPLRERVLANGGTVYPGERARFQLLIDIKNTGEDTYLALDEVLRDPRYGFLFSHYENGEVTHGPITVAISGDRPRELMEQQESRYAFYDGRIADEDDLGPGSDPGLTPLVSENWTELFSWNGSGAMPEDERAELHEIVSTAHQAGQRVRFWATPDDKGAEREAVWRALVDAGVDHINTDDLAGLRDFLTARG
ncbi:MAG: hypothetical protein GEU98_06800 [Pseudonocardiaceae bacterium]|nr:hypothetical protein [Pseudonocardiaceae bacterium]